MGVIRANALARGIYGSRNNLAVSADIPEEWYAGDRPSLERLVEELSNRRVIIRKLIEDFRKSIRNPFPNWTDSPSFAVPSVATCDEAVEIR